MITAEFNRLRINRNRNNWNWNRESQFPGQETLAYFDCRVFTIPDRVEVMNYFRWRQQDCIRNSVSMVAQSNFSHKQLHGKSQRDMHDMLHSKGVNWATDYTDGEKNGRIILKETYELDPVLEQVGPIERTRWVAKDAWVFTKDEGKLLNMIPKYEQTN
jgi:tRNA(His) 5'-end guanylyltransferase